MVVAVVVVTSAVNLAAAVADYSRAKVVLANCAEEGIPLSWLPFLATAKLAGALGLIAGLAGFRLLGLTAAIGLVAFFIGAVVVHIRAKAFRTIAFPVAFLALAVASLATW